MNIVKATIVLSSFLILSGCSTSTPTGTKSSVSPSTQSSTGTTYSLAEVGKHSTESDCWLVIDTNVYNVTDFVSRHPGGKDILKGCGKDATTLFKNQPKHAGPEAQSLLPEFKIGMLQ